MFYSSDVLGVACGYSEGKCIQFQGTLHYVLEIIFKRITNGAAMIWYFTHLKGKIEKCVERWPNLQEGQNS